MKNSAFALALSLCFAIFIILMMVFCTMYFEKMKSDLYVGVLAPIVSCRAEFAKGHFIENKLMDDVCGTIPPYERFPKLNLNPTDSE